MDNDRSSKRNCHFEHSSPIPKCASAGERVERISSAVGVRRVGPLIRPSVCPLAPGPPSAWISF